MSHIVLKRLLARLRVSVDRSPEEADVLALARYRGLTSL